jgi:hypothetical protein
MVLAMRATAPNILTIANGDFITINHHGALVTGS